MQRKILIDALNKSSATDSLIPGKAPPTPPRPMDPSQALLEEKIVYNITIDDLNIHEIFEHSLATMIRNRRELIKEIFSILAPHEIKAMLPESFRELKPKEVMKLCYMQLKEMPENHLTAIITCLADPSQCTIPVYKTVTKSKRSSDSPSGRSPPKQSHNSSSEKTRDRSPAYKLDKPKSNPPKRSSHHSSEPQKHKSIPDKKKENSNRSSPSRKKPDKSPKKPTRKNTTDTSKSRPGTGPGTSTGTGTGAGTGTGTGKVIGTGTGTADQKRLYSSVQSASKSSNSKSKHHSSSSRDKKQKKN